MPLDAQHRDAPGSTQLKPSPAGPRSTPLEDVLGDIESLAPCGSDATPLLDRLRARLESAQAAQWLPGVRGIFLEWLDPAYRAGHWTPDLLALAGIDDPLAQASLRSRAPGPTWPPPAQSS